MKRIFSLIGVLGIIALTCGAIINWINKGFTLASKISFLTGSALILIAIIYLLYEQRAFFTRRGTKYGMNAFVIIIFFFGVIILLNFLSAKHKYSFDTTKNKAYSLSDQTVKELKNLKLEINVYIFTGKDDPRSNQIKELLGRYAYASSNVKIYNIDPDREPQKAKQYAVKSYGTVVINYEGRVEKIEDNVTEEKVTAALIRVSKNEIKKIYFIKGHGERDPFFTEKDGYSAIKDALTEVNFYVDTLFLLQVGIIPDDASLLVISAPQYDYTDSELVRIGNYLNNGGKLLVQIEPGKYPTLSNWLSDFGIKADDDIIVDVSGAGMLFGANEIMPVVGNYDKTSPITKDFNGATLFPTARSIRKEDDTKGFTIVELAKTSPQSWGEMDYNTDRFAMDKNRDLPGPMNIAVSSSKTTANGKETRIVAFGDADFSSNTYYKFSGNRDLFLNSINWLVLDEGRIAIRPTEELDSRIILSSRTQKLILYLLVVILPLIALLISGFVWWKRRG